MPINYGLIDPTEGMNRGLGTLAQALQYRQQMERQALQDAATAKSQGLQNTLSEIGIKKSTAEQNALIEAMKGQDPSVTDLPTALAAQMRGKLAIEKQDHAAKRLESMSNFLKVVRDYPGPDSEKQRAIREAATQFPDFAEFLKAAIVKTPEKPGDYELKTQYGPNGETKIVPVLKTAGMTPEPGTTFTAPLKPDTLSPEAEAQRKRIAAAGERKDKPPASHDAVYIDKANGAKHVVNLRNPKHQRWLARYGSQLIREDANPVNQAMIDASVNNAPAEGKDKFGFVIGEVKKGHKYIGNDQWQKQ